MKRTHIILTTVTLCMVLCACGKTEGYEETAALTEAESYENATTALSALEDQKDSVQETEECRKLLRYEEADQLFASGMYEDALTIFTELGDYADSAEKVKECEDALAYNKAVALVEEGSYTEAMATFSTLHAGYGYKDTRDYIGLCQTQSMLTDPLFEELENVIGVDSLETTVDTGLIYRDVRDDWREDTLLCYLTNYQLLEPGYVFKMGDGTELRMPMTYGELYEAGWRVDEERGWSGFHFENAQLSDPFPGEEREYLGFINRNGKGLYTRVYNPSEETIELRDAAVMWFGAGWDYYLQKDESELAGCYEKNEYAFDDGDVYVSYYRIAESFTVNGIEKGATAADIIEKFGWPYQIEYVKVTSEESTSAIMEFVYYGNAEEENEGCMVFQIDAEEGALISVGYSLDYVVHHA